MDYQERRILELKAEAKIRTIARMCNEFVQDYIYGRIDRITFNDATADLRLLLEEFNNEIKEINDDLNADKS